MTTEQRLDKIEKMLESICKSIGIDAIADRISQKEMLTITEAAYLLGKPVSFLYKNNAKEYPEITFSKPNGKEVYYSRKDVMAYLNRNKRLSGDAVNELANESLKR